MPTFATPEPIDLRINIASGGITVEAGAVTETEVEVEPYKPGRSEDVETAEHTTVDFSDGRLVIDGPEKGRKWFGRSGSVRVRVRLPEGSNVRVKTASADLHGSGRFGNTELNTASGDLHVENVASLRAECASGDINCRTVDGDARVTTASGSVSVERVGGNAEASSASGDARIGEVNGDLRINTASGDAAVEVAHGSVTGKFASGDLRVGRVERGQVHVDGASGDVYLGVATGTAAWLDVTSLSGDVSSQLDQSDQPSDGEQTVEIQIRTLSGDVVIARA
ncbi:DUF4097 family beta strand repeat-containing protein [Flindersiella endophytica]